MKIVLHLALSADGFIAKPDGDSGWVSESDEALFLERCRSAGALVSGRRTFVQYKDIIYPVSGAFNIVLSRSDSVDGADAVVKSPQEAVQIAKDKGCTGLLVAGGAEVSGAFLSENLVDEIFFSVHPIFFYEGLKPFGSATPNITLQTIGSRELSDGLVELHYKVMKS
jgi:dihydrofolate reductase